ncbi:hypothetical protein J4221_07120 [Candidatus Pacearchaeota archaeon]|nr:hypothetical protein [Candidatus Pacearchaeota archaeon]
MVDGYESEVGEYLGCIPMALGAFVLCLGLGLGSIIALNADKQKRPSDISRITLERKFEAYSANINNDNYPDLIMSNKDYKAFLGQENGSYKPYNLTEQQRKTIKDAL